MSRIPVSSPRPELQVAVDAVLEAGRAVMGVYAGDFSSETKRDGSPITEADIKSNRIIKAALKKSGHWMLSEEGKDGKDRLGQDVVWIVDPLDGTSDFIKRTGEFTIMIALVEKKVPVIGVVFWPVGRTLFVAQEGQGAYRLADGVWERIHVTGETELGNCRAVGSRSHLSEEERALFERLGVKEFSGVGSSLKVGKISSGEAEMYVTTTNRMMEWDSCASFCIINEAGGRMTDILGNVLTYNNEVVNHLHGIVASNGLIHDKIIAGLGSAGA